jgi:hypothetical protein
MPMDLTPSFSENNFFNNPVLVTVILRIARYKMNCGVLRAPELRLPISGELGALPRKLLQPTCTPERSVDVKTAKAGQEK